MFNEERYNYIISKLEREERVRVTELSEELDISEVTIRKDLNHLEEKNILKRTHGGAILSDKHVVAETIENKMGKNIESKKKIASLAESFLEDDLIIFLDAGTTVQALLPRIEKLKNLTVITYDLEIAYRLSEFSDISLYMLGGYINKDTKTAVSIEGYENLSNIHADICFIGTDAFDQNYVYSTSENKGKIKNKMILNSSKSILICDSTKYEKKGLYSFYKCQDFDYFITDENNKELIKKFSNKLGEKFVFKN